MSVMSGEVDKISRIRNKYAKVILPIKDEGDSIIGVIVATASTNAIDQTYHSMLKSTIQLGLIIVPLVFIAVLIVSWLTVRGLREMNRKIAYISEGNLEAQLPVKGFRETRYLARNYNSVISIYRTFYENYIVFSYLQNHYGGLSGVHDGYCG